MDDSQAKIYYEKLQSIEATETYKNQNAKIIKAYTQCVIDNKTYGETKKLMFEIVRKLFRRIVSRKKLDVSRKEIEVMCSVIFNRMIKTYNDPSFYDRMALTENEKVNTLIAEVQDKTVFPKITKALKPITMDDLE